MQKVSLPAFAKINLSLDVLRKRPDSYHDMRMIMQTVALCDEISVEKADKAGIELDSDLRFLPKNGKNLVVSAAELFCSQQSLFCGVKLQLRKSIPVSAGLAGGSADAAAVLIAMNLLFETNLSQEQLCQMGKKLGADVPFCIVGGTALVEGIGDIITSLPAMPPCHIVLCKPRFGISTAYVFSKLNCQKLKEHPDTRGLIQAIEQGNLQMLARRIFNVMESVTASEHPEIAEIKSKMLDCGALGCTMSGSGPTVFGLFESQVAAHQAYSLLKQQYHEVYETTPHDCLAHTEILCV